jgi:hypothetical protein
MADDQSEANRQQLRDDLDRAADDGWPTAGGGIGSTNRAEQARRAIALLRAWHETQPDRSSGHETIGTYVDNARSPEELTRLLEGMTALADFLLSNLERATGREGQEFLESVRDQAGQYFHDKN